MVIRDKRSRDNESRLYSLLANDSVTLAYIEALAFVRLTTVGPGLSLSHMRRRLFSHIVAYICIRINPFMPSGIFYLSPWTDSFQI